MVDRAADLATGGHSRTWQQVVQKLKAEDHQNVDAHFASAALRKFVKELIRDAEGAGAQFKTTASPK